MNLRKLLVMRMEIKVLGVRANLNFKIITINQEHKKSSIKKSRDTTEQTISVHNICIVYKSFSMLTEAMKVMI